MSRIGRLPVPVPAGVDVTIDGNDVTVKGPKGTLSRTIAQPLSVTRQEDGTILVTRPNDERESRSLHGLSRTLIKLQFEPARFQLPVLLELAHLQLQFEPVLQ